MNQKITSSPSPKPLDEPLIRGLATSGRSVSHRSGRLDEPLIRGLATSIRYAVRILAVLMVLVI